MSKVGKRLSLITEKHESVVRDYLGRVNDPVFPKAKAAELAKEWGYDYWDGDRRVNYGGYHFISGYWTPLAQKIIEEFHLTSQSSVLDVGCGKGFLLRELLELLPGIRVIGLDISQYALDRSPPEVRGQLILGNATSLPFGRNEFDLVVSLNTLHNLYTFELDVALTELERVARQKYLVVESYRTEVEKANLLYWQVTCESFFTPDEWLWWFKRSGYSGDFEFIYFR